MSYILVHANSSAHELYTSREEMCNLYPNMHISSDIATLLLIMSSFSYIYIKLEYSHALILSRISLKYNIIMQYVLKQR